MQYLTFTQRFYKRLFDIVFSFVAIVLFFPLIIAGFIISSLDVKGFGLFFQKRVGLNGRLFSIVKIKTMKNINGLNTTVTNLNDRRITKTGLYLRKYKIDELPQLWNVLIGDMSFVGPRPDVQGYADKLTGEDRIVLSIRPGITGPASIKYKNEEEILANQSNLEEYNLNIIWPDKVQINKAYIKNYTFFKDIKYIWQTIVG